MERTTNTLRALLNVFHCEQLSYQRKVKTLEKDFLFQYNFSGRGRAVAALGLSFFQDYLNGLTSPVVNDVLIIGSATHLVHLVRL